MPLNVEPPFVLVKPVDDEAGFYALADEDAPWELLDGRLVMSPASDRHENLFRFLLTLLSGWLDERGGGVVRGSRYPMRLDPRWSPEPDLLVVTDAHLHRMTPQRLEGPADLVVEIASDGDPLLDEREKLPRYREARIPEIWLVSPQTDTLRVDRLRDPHGRTGGPGGGATGRDQGAADDYETLRVTRGTVASRVLPGFQVEAEWLWREPLPSTMTCLRALLD